MKKLAKKSRKPPSRKGRPKPPAAVSGRANLQFMQRILADYLPFAEDCLEQMIEPILSVEPGGPEDVPSEEALSELDEALSQRRIDAAGGDAAAREELKSVRAMIDKAAERDAIHPAMLILLGRMFAGAGIDIGHAARAAMERIMDSDAFLDSEEAAYSAFVRPLFPAQEGSPFALCQAIDVMIAILPSRYKNAFVERLAADSNALARQAAVGFLLHRDEPLAEAAIRGLSAAAGRGGLDSESRQRVEIIRPWLAPARQTVLEAELPSAGSPAHRAASVVKATATVCDGSGASTVSAIVRRGSNTTIATVMIKSTGVAEVMMFEDLSERETARFENFAGASVPTSRVSIATMERLLRLALGRNLSQGAPPPFALVQAVEAIGLESLMPDRTAPAELIETVLAEIPDHDRAEMIRAAHQSIADGEFAENWFEAGEDVDAILETTASVIDGAQALLERCLPGRRAFWATQCARSALAMKDEAEDDGWRHLVLVGRDILGGASLSDIPLMQRIAEKSAVAHFMQR